MERENISVDIITVHGHEHVVVINGMAFEPFQRDRLFQPTRLLTGASFHREKLSTRHTNGWGTGQKGAAQARSPSGSPPHAAVPRDLAQTHQAVHTLFGVRAAWSFYD